MIGRVKTKDVGSYGYVISRQAAIVLLQRFPRPSVPVDCALSQSEYSGLRRIFYLDSAAMLHDNALPSSIDDRHRRHKAAAKERWQRNPFLRLRRKSYRTVWKRRSRRMWEELRAEDMEAGGFGPLLQESPECKRKGGP